MQRPEDWGAAVVCRQVRPAGRVPRNLRRDVEDGAARHREYEVSQDGGDTLVLRIDVVGVARVVGGAGGGVVGVQADEPRDVGVRVGEIELLQVALQLGGVSDIVGEKSEQGAFVFLVAYDVRNFGVLAGEASLFRTGRQESTVWPR